MLKHLSINMVTEFVGIIFSSFRFPKNFLKLYLIIENQNNFGYQSAPQSLNILMNSWYLNKNYSQLLHFCFETSLTQGLLNWSVLSTWSIRITLHGFADYLYWMWGCDKLEIEVFRCPKWPDDCGIKMYLYLNVLLWGASTSIYPLLSNIKHANHLASASNYDLHALFSMWRMFLCYWHTWSFQVWSHQSLALFWH